MMEKNESNLVFEIFDNLPLILQALIRALITLPTLITARGNILMVVSGLLCVYYIIEELIGGWRITTTLFHALSKWEHVIDL